MLTVLGFVCVALVGLLLLLRERGRRVQSDKVLIVGTILANIGMLFVASGLAWLDRLPGTTAWITSFIVGPILLAMGILLATLKRKAETR